MVKKIDERPLSPDDVKGGVDQTMFDIAEKESRKREEENFVVRMRDLAKGKELAETVKGQEDLERETKMRERESQIQKSPLRR